MLGWMGVGGQEKPGDFSRPPTDEFNFVAMQPGAQASETGYRFPRAPVSRTVSGHSPAVIDIEPSRHTKIRV